MEYAWINNWSVKAEYLYVKFDGSINASGQVSTHALGPFTNLVQTSANLSAQIARAGINYKFY
jgi:outer membrane immunogenic protein